MKLQESAVVMQRLEGFILFILAAVFYSLFGSPLWVFVVVFFAVDVSMIGYAVSPRAGAITYNIFHSLALPLILLAWTSLLGDGSALPVAVAWLGHIGIDRALGYGLKQGSFQDTHLGRIGRTKRVDE